MPTPFTESDQWLADSLSESLRMSLEAMTSERPEVSWTAGDASADISAWVWWEQPVTAGPGSICWVGSAADTRMEIGKRALLAAGIDDATPDDCHSTWKEILGQSLSGLSQGIGRRLRKDVNCEAGKDLSAAPSIPVFADFQIGFGDGVRFALRAGWSEALRKVLQPADPQAAASAPSGAGSKPKANGASKAAPAVEGSRTLDLLLEVELPVSVSFGRTQIPLKDVLKLTSGSIVELNRSIGEPVDLIVNNCVIARGEVVVVEGNYGVRIKHIISKEERLRTLY